MEGQCIMFPITNGKHWVLCPECRNVFALRQLTVVKLRTKCIAGFETSVDHLLAYQSDICDIPRLLLAYLLHG